MTIAQPGRRATPTTSPNGGGKPARAGAPVRELRPDDLDAVVAIDRAHVGRSRRGFFEKRLAAVRHGPGNFVALGVERGGKLAGHAIARRGHGEFGGADRTATLDSISVDPAAAGRGLGAVLMAALGAALQARGVRELYSQTDWSNRSMLGFFSASGFALAPRVLLERGLTPGPVVAIDEAAEPRDHAWMRSMDEGDLAAIIEIDRRTTGRNAETLYEGLMVQAVEQSGVRVSLVAELDERIVGFAMARMDYGEYGRTEPIAALDTMGVHPDFRHISVASALLSQLFMNLRALNIETVRTIVAWDNFDLLRFMAASGFKPAQRLSFRRSLN